MFKCFTHEMNLVLKSLGQNPRGLSNLTLMDSINSCAKGNKQSKRMKKLVFLNVSKKQGIGKFIPIPSLIHAFANMMAKKSDWFQKSAWVHVVAFCSTCVVVYFCCIVASFLESSFLKLFNGGLQSEFIQIFVMDLGNKKVKFNSSWFAKRIYEIRSFPIKIWL